MRGLGWIEDLRGRVDARSRRERLLLAGAALVFVVLIWDFAVRAPLQQQWTRAVEQAGNARAEIDQLQASARQLEEQIAAARSRSGTSPEATLRERISRVDEALSQRTRRVISPLQMVTVLRELVTADQGVTLVSLRNTGVEPLIAESRGTDGSREGGADAGVPRVYRHSAELVIEGSYFDLVAYLERLEELDWQLQWDALAMETVDYPRARVTISLSTLSLAEDWIGV